MQLPNAVANAVVDTSIYSLYIFEERRVMYKIKNLAGVMQP